MKSPLMPVGLWVWQSSWPVVLYSLPLFGKTRKGKEMESKQDYRAEIIQALKQRPRSGLELRLDLAIPESLIKILESMEDEGCIYWVQTQEVGGEWRVK